MPPDVQAQISKVRERLSVIEAVGGEKAKALEGLTDAFELGQDERRSDYRAIDTKLDAYHIETTKAIGKLATSVATNKTETKGAHDRLNTFRNIFITLGTGIVLTGVAWALTQ